MSTQSPERVSVAALTRRVVRGGVVGLFLGLLVTAGTAMADEPAGWEQTKNVSFLHGFTIIILIPIALAIVITLLVSLPGYIKGMRDHQAAEGEVVRVEK